MQVQYGVSIDRLGRSKARAPPVKQHFIKGPGEIAKWFKGHRFDGRMRSIVTPAPVGIVFWSLEVKNAWYFCVSAK